MQNVIFDLVDITFQDRWRKFDFFIFTLNFLYQLKIVEFNENALIIELSIFRKENWRLFCYCIFWSERRVHRSR